MVTETILKQWMTEDNGTILPDPLHPGVFTGYVTYTPDRARNALENNVKNRTPGRQGQIPSIKESICSGKWDDNVSKINFDSDGVLSDGQNRLIACSDTGINIRVLTTWGVNKTAQHVTDRRGSRKLSDDLTIAGFRNSASLAAMARIQYYKSKGYTAKQILNRGSQYIKAPDVLVFDFFINNSDQIIQENKRCERIYESVRDLKISGDVLRTLVPEFDSISITDATEFWDRLSSGVTDREDDAIILLRRRLAASSRNTNIKIPNNVVAALIIKAWNMFEIGKPCGTLKFISGGAHPEEFPEIFNPYKEEGDR